SAATIMSLGIYQRYLKREASDEQLVSVGRMTSAILAIFAIGIAPFVADASAGLYQLLQQLNGIFFVPIATVVIAGFFFPRVSAIGALAGLVFGLLFYVLTYFLWEVQLHFVHIWGIEFVLNLLVMHGVSLVYPNDRPFRIQDAVVLDLQPWKYARSMGIILVLITLFIYLLLGNIT
ncbi:MAG: solute:sodium symporter family transporter, partial [Bacteroidota bacterium]